MSKFIIKETNTGVKFDLNIDDKVVATSEVYTSLSACQNGIESVKKNSALNKIEDTTVDSAEKVSYPKFQIFLDKANKFRFRLCASNGQIIAVGNDFENKEDCEFIIGLIVKHASTAEVVKA